MPSHAGRKKSFRETGQFSAIDQEGLPHRVVERIETLHDVGASGCVVDAARGASCFHSATSGDVLVRQADGSFETSDGRLRLRVDPRTS